jgi:hypothetical protein
MGYAYKQDKPATVYKIGSILKKAGKQELLTKFNKRTSTVDSGNSTTEDQEYVMVISHNPEDVVSMSSYKCWTSCVDFTNPKAQNPETAFEEVQYGGMVAYLISKKFAHLQDKEEWLDHSTSRIMIRRFIDDVSGGYMFFQENRIYGDAQVAEHLDMEEKLKSLLDKSNKSTYKKGLYSIANRGGYSDSLKGKLFSSPDTDVDIKDELQNMLYTDRYDDTFLNYLQRNSSKVEYNEALSELVVGNLRNNNSFANFGKVFNRYHEQSLFDVNIINDIFEQFDLNVSNTGDKKEILNNYYKLEFALSFLPTDSAKNFLKRFMSEVDSDSTTYELLQKIYNSKFK